MNIIKLKNRFIHFSSVCACRLWHEHRESRTICGSWPFFQHLVPRGWAQVVSLGGKHLYPLGHLIPEVWINTDGGWVSWSTVPVAPLILRVDLPLWDPTQPHSHPPLAMSSAPPQTYLWSFPSSFKINLSKYMCVHACSYKWIQTQHICVPTYMCGSYRKKSGISPCLPPCSAWFPVLCCECQASWPSASQDPDASAFHPALRMMRLQMCATMPGFMWVSLELTLQPPTDILKHWDHTHKPLCLLYLWNFHLGRCYM